MVRMKNLSTKLKSVLTVAFTIVTFLFTFERRYNEEQRHSQLVGYHSARSEKMRTTPNTRANRHASRPVSNAEDEK